MPKLPVVSGMQALRAFERLGWEYFGRRSSHMYLRKPGVPVRLSVPDHKELDRGTLRSLISQAGITVEQFVGAQTR